MAEWRLLAVGRIGQTPESALFTRYNDRLRPGLIVTEFADGRGSPGEIKRREAEVIVSAVPTGAFVVALDSGGKAPDSAGLAGMLTGWTERTQKLAFVIGGAEGLGAAVLERAGHVLSLGPLTWPHMLARVMLAEQLFRAQAIASGHPYHRAGRPI